MNELPPYTQPTARHKGGKRIVAGRFEIWSALRQKRTFADFGPNTVIVDAGRLGRKRGIFVLVADAITKDNSAMNTN